jgi:predicted DNA-binding transcriptional regulator AlpA
MNAPEQSLAVVLADLVTVGKRLVEVSESCLALMGESDAECRPSPRGPDSRADAQMPSPSLLLTRDETIAVLRIGDRTFSRLRSDPAQKFPAPVRGRPLRWRRSDLDAWIARGRR